MLPTNQLRQIIASLPPEEQEAITNAYKEGDYKELRRRLGKKRADEIKSWETGRAPRTAWDRFTRSLPIELLGRTWAKSREVLPEKYQDKTMKWLVDAMTAPGISPGRATSPEVIARQNQLAEELYGPQGVPDMTLGRHLAEKKKKSQKRKS